MERHNMTVDLASDPAQPLEALRRKLGFRAWHRGTREADLLIGSFADRHLPDFGPDELRQFERLLTENDPDIYDWMTGRKPVPREHANRVTDLLRQFQFASKTS
jgi:antitoxin CptB